MKFVEKLERRMGKVGNTLVIGLDTNVEKLPEGFEKNADGVLKYNEYVINATKDVACAYKINSAFYEMLGPDGMQAMKRTVDMIDKDIPLIYDFKRGDISNTARAYAKAAFEYYNFDAVTLSIYMGWDTVEPFLSYKDKYIFIVCLSSNESAVDFQYHGNPPLYLEVATSVSNSSENCGLVVGAKAIRELETVHEVSPKSFILVPGVGAQGGDAKKVMNCKAKDKVIVNVSRAIIFSENPRQVALKYAKELERRD